MLNSLRYQNNKDLINFIVFLFVLTVAWSPFKKISYVAPFTSILLLFILSGDFRVLLKCFVVSISIVAYGALVQLLLQYGNFTNVLVFVVTSSSLSFLFAISWSCCDQRQFYFKTSKVILWIIFTEAIIGIIQGGYGAIFSGSFDGGVGDHVEGTIHLALESSRSFSNPLFATNMCFSLLYVLPHVFFNKDKFGIVILGGTAVLLASVMHLLLFLVLALVLTVLILEGWRLLSKTGIAVASIVLLGVMVTCILFPRNVENIRYKVELLHESRSPKAMVLNAVTSSFPEVNSIIPVFGVGPGQFSSRASHLSSGYLIGDVLNGVGAGRSELFVTYMDPILTWVYGFYSNPGSTENPFFSWGMICSEFGIIGVVLVFLLLIKGMSVRKYYDSSDPLVKSCVFVTITIVLFFFLLGSQDSYWEVPQVSLLVMMFIHILRKLILNELKTSD